MRDVGWPNELPDPSITPDRPNEEKGRYLRALYRAYRPSQRINEFDKLVIDQNQAARQHRVVVDEYKRLFGRSRWDHDLSLLIKDVWTEASELAGQRYDYGIQAWIGPDGERIWD